MELPKNSQPDTAAHHRTSLPSFHLIWMALTSDSTGDAMLALSQPYKTGTIIQWRTRNTGNQNRKLLSVIAVEIIVDIPASLWKTPWFHAAELYTAVQDPEDQMAYFHMLWLCVANWSIDYLILIFYFSIM